MPGPSLSILVPTYDRAAMLAQALESLAVQTELPADLEVIVSDDASPTAEATAAVVRTFEGRLPNLRYFQQEKNLGGEGNWTFCLGQATGDLVFLLSHDDAVAPDFLATYLGLFRLHPELDLVTSDIELRGPDLETVLAPQVLPTPEGPADGPTRVRCQLESHHMVMATVYRRSVLIDAGGWDKQVGSHLDCTAYCRSSLRSRLTWRVARPMLRFRLSAGSWSHKLTTDPAKQGRLAGWYRTKLDLLREDARTLAPDLLPFLDRMYAWHARLAMMAMEVDLGTGAMSRRSTREAMRALLAVFPEGKHDRKAWQLRLATAVGPGPLAAARRLVGRPDPTATTLALFHGVPGAGAGNANAAH